MNYLKNTVSILILFAFVLNAQSQELPWGDNFDDGNYDGWTVVDVAPFASGPSNWTVRNNELLQTSNIFTTENEYSVFTGTHVFTGNGNWTDYYFLSRITSTDDDGVGILFRYRDEKNYYRFLTVADPANRGPFKRRENR